MLSHNVFAYCVNDPVNKYDPNGRWAIGALGAIFSGGIFSAVAVVVAVAYAVVSAVQKAGQAYGASKSKEISNPQPKTATNNKKTGYIGQNGTKVTSKTTWQKGKTERVDVENPGNRDGDVHYHTPKNVKYRYDLEDGKFYDTDGNLAPPKVQDKLNDPEIKKGIEKGKKYWVYNP